MRTYMDHPNGSTIDAEVVDAADYAFAYLERYFTDLEGEMIGIKDRPWQLGMVITVPKDMPNKGTVTHKARDVQDKLYFNLGIFIPIEVVIPDDDGDAEALPEIIQATEADLDFLIGGVE